MVEERKAESLERVKDEIDAELEGKIIHLQVRMKCCFETARPDHFVCFRNKLRSSR